MRKVADESGAVLIGETWTANIAQLDKYYGDGRQRAADADGFHVHDREQAFRAGVPAADCAVDSAKGWPVFVISNHDIVRSYNRYGDGKHNDAIAKLMATFYLTLRGSPIMYYGEESGMENNDPKRKEDVQDPIGRTGWPAREGTRWRAHADAVEWRANAGFSGKTPWLPVPPSYATHNVESEAKDPEFGVERV